MRTSRPAVVALRATRKRSERNGFAGSGRVDDVARTVMNLDETVTKEPGPSPGTREKLDEGDFENALFLMFPMMIVVVPVVFDVRNHPHPSPLPEYRARG